MKKLNKEKTNEVYAERQFLKGYLKNLRENYSFTHEQLRAISGNSISNNEFFLSEQDGPENLATFMCQLNGENGRYSFGRSGRSQAPNEIKYNRTLVGVFGPFASDIVDGYRQASQRLRKLQNYLEASGTNIGFYDSLEKKTRDEARVACRQLHANTDIDKIEMGNECSVSNSIDKSSSYYTRAVSTITIPQHWSKTVFDKGIALVELGGKQHMVLKAKELHGDWEEEGIILYDATVAWIKREENNYMSPYLVHSEKKFVARHNDGSGWITATGKDEKWAVRTLQGRMMKRMMGSMKL